MYSLVTPSARFKHVRKIVANLTSTVVANARVRRALLPMASVSER